MSVDHQTWRLWIFSIVIHGKKFCFSTTITRFTHLTNTIQRTEAGGDINIEILKFKNEAYATDLKLGADLYNKVKNPVDKNFLNATFAGPLSKTSR